MMKPSSARAVAALFAFAVVACGGPDTSSTAAPGDPAASASPSPNPSATPTPAPTPTPTPTPNPNPNPNPTPTPGPAPIVTALGVHGAPPAGGTTVTIAGSGFVAGTAVTFGGAASPSVVFDAVNHVLAAVTPPHAEGFVDVVVSNPDGQSSTVPGFHYGPPPAPASFSPGTIAKAGDLVVIDGVDFAAVQVLFGPGVATIVAQTATAVTVSAPKLNPGSYQVIVTNPDGQFGVAPGLLVYPGP